ncbi:MAG: outer membrane lipoprotein carrier protein LolA [Verrucomicrobiales bacterium]|nr:outer membrane lipoprotein carrier protein LolA [Verrucomicrobiales bacterium]
MNRRRFLTLAAAACAADSARADTDLTPVRKWIERQAALKTLRASFRQLRFLKSVRKPLESAGKIWYAAPGSIRWESGDPPKIIAAVKTGGNLTVLHVGKRRAEVITAAQMKEKSDSQGIAFLESGFPGSMAEFQRRFAITAVERAGSYHRVDATLAEGANPVVRKFSFFILDSAWTLGGLHFQFRDGSRAEITFSDVVENAEIPPGCFDADLTGYAVETSG